MEHLHVFKILEASFLAPMFFWSAQLLFCGTQTALDTICYKYWYNMRPPQKEQCYSEVR